MKRRCSLPVNNSNIIAKGHIAGNPCVGSHRQKADAEKQHSRSRSRSGSSRCEEDFIELYKIGRGGYGSVYAVRNRLDGLVYAMKKIQFKNSCSQLMDKVLREVKTLALLNHPNVVRYHSAWIESPKNEDLQDELETSSPNTTNNNNTNNTNNTCNSHIDKHNDTSEDTSSEGECSSDEDDLSIHSNESWSDSSDMEQFNPLKLTNELLSSDSMSNTEPINLRESQIILPPRKPHPIFPPYPNATETTQSLSTSTSAKRDKKRNINTTLCIVMQLYTTTLSQWLDNRPPGMVEKRLNIHIFHQICRGLEYIHSKGVIHRDLKPGNIFINMPSPGYNDMTVCLGDFGLATQNSPVTPPGSLGSSVGLLRISSELSCSPSSIPLSISTGDDDLGRIPILTTGGSGRLDTPTTPRDVSGKATTPPTVWLVERKWESRKHTSAVGTHTYASPEQRNKGPYNEKTDIFSLGILFFELCYPCATKMEKARVLGDLRNRILPPEFLQTHPREASFILWLSHPDPDQRPSAKDIMQFQIDDELILVGRRDWQGLTHAVSHQNDVILRQQQLINDLQQQMPKDTVQEIVQDVTRNPPISISSSSKGSPPPFPLSSSAPLPTFSIPAPSSYFPHSPSFSPYSSSPYSTSPYTPPYSSSPYSTSPTSSLAISTSLSPPSFPFLHQYTPPK